MAGNNSSAGSHAAARIDIGGSPGKSGGLGGDSGFERRPGGKSGITRWQKFSTPANKPSGEGKGWVLKGSKGRS